MDAVEAPSDERAASAPNLQILAFGPGLGHSFFVVVFLWAQIRRDYFETISISTYSVLADFSTFFMFYIASLLLFYVFGFLPALVGGAIYVGVTRRWGIRKLGTRLLVASILSSAATLFLTPILFLSVMREGILSIMLMVGLPLFAGISCVLLFDRHSAG